MAERPVIHRAIRVATEDTFTSLRPGRYASMTDIQIGLQIFETLVGYDRSLRLEGRLAESWECTPDRLGYRFVLRPGARFHDGEPVTATAVRGTLVVMWLTASEREAFESGKVTVGMLRIW